VNTAQRHFGPAPPLPTLVVNIGKAVKHSEPTSCRSAGLKMRATRAATHSSWCTPPQKGMSFPRRRLRLRRQSAFALVSRSAAAHFRSSGSRRGQSPC